MDQSIEKAPHTETPTQRGVRFASWLRTAWEWARKPSRWLPASCLVLVLVDTFIKPLTYVSLGLLVTAAAPYWFHLVRSLELPGGLKVELREELERLTEKAEGAGLLRHGQPNEQGPAYLDVFARDPVLAMAGLRIEIEQRLRKIGTQADVLTSGTRFVPMPELIARLQSVGTLKPNEAVVLLELLPTLNRAIHERETDIGAASWAISVGPQILAALDAIEPHPAAQ